MDAQLLNDITSVFVTAIEAGTATLLAFSLPLLAIFATIAFYMQLGPQLASGGGGVGEALASVLALVLKIGIFEWLLLHLPFLNPGEVANTGFRLARPIRDFTDAFVKWLAVWDWPTLLLYSLSYYLIVLSFGFIALHLMMTIIEFHLAVMVGAVLMPWGVLHATASVAEFSLGWITGGLVRVLITAGIVGIATPLFAQVRLASSSGQDPTFYSALLAGIVSGIFAILAWVIPARAAAIAGRGVSLALDGGTVVAGAASGARFATVARGAIAGGVRGVSTLIQSARAGYRRS